MEIGAEQVAVVTGGASGIGLAMATVFGQRGCRSSVAGIEADRFWILPHQHYGHRAIELATARVEGGPPHMPRLQ